MEVSSFQRRKLGLWVVDDGKILLYPEVSVRRARGRREKHKKWLSSHGNSYFSFFVDSGVHHLCANWQSAVLLAKGRKTAAAHFTAQAGGAYYFQIKNTYWLDHGSAGMSLKPLDSDQGQLLANTFPLSIPHQR